MSRNEANGLINELMNKPTNMKDKTKIIDARFIGVAEVDCDGNQLKKGDWIYRPVKEEPIPDLLPGDLIEIHSGYLTVAEVGPTKIFFWEGRNYQFHFLDGLNIQSIRRNGKLLWSKPND